MENLKTTDTNALKAKLWIIEEKIDRMEEIGDNHADIAVQVNRYNNLKRYINSKRDSKITSIEILK